MINVLRFASIFLIITFSLSILYFSSPSPNGPYQTQKNFITYEKGEGRFGDQLITYLHAKWLSYRHDIPLLYKKFPHSSEFMLHDEKSHFSKNHRRYFQQIPLTKTTDIKTHADQKSIIYLAQYFPECQWERTSLEYKNISFDVDWKDPLFRQIAKKMLIPKRHVPSVVPPKNTINIALHFREGGNLELKGAHLIFPLKFPPLEFYIEGLLKIIDLFPEKNLYCYLFTDAINPPEIIEKIQTFIPPQTRIILDCRRKDNGGDRNIVKDFLSFFEFDVLIHPQSNFSLIPALIHDYAITYTPISCLAEQNGYKIDQIKCEINQLLYHNLLSK